MHDLTGSRQFHYAKFSLFPGAYRSVLKPLELFIARCYGVAKLIVQNK